MLEQTLETPIFAALFEAEVDGLSLSSENIVGFALVVLRKFGLRQAAVCCKPSQMHSIELRPGP